MIVDCAHYNDGRRQHQGRMALEDAARKCQQQEGFVWLGTFEPSPDELAEVSAAFGLHELAVEDALTIHLRPKIERYSDELLFVVLRTARYDDAKEEVEFGQVSVFIAPDFVITVRQGVGSDLHDARLRLEERPELLKTGPPAVFWAILDKVVDDYRPVVEGLESDIEEVERTVFTGSVAPTERIYFLRREATDFFRAVHPLVAPMEGAERGTIGHLGGALLPYFRDVGDHLRLVNDEVASQRDILATVLEANMAVISTQQTQISLDQTDAMKQLTIIATIFLPLSFIVGFFGQNFAWLTGHVRSSAAFVTLGLGGLVVSCLLLLFYFRRSRYI